MLASKTIRAELYGLTRFKRKLLEDLQAWDRAQALERPDSERANEAASYYCRALAWKAGDRRKAPILIDKDSFKLTETGNRFARFFVSVSTLYAHLVPAADVALPRGASLLG